MLAILIGILLGIFICLFIPPQELAVKVITFAIKACDVIQTKGREQLERIEKENEKTRNSSTDQHD